MDEFLTEAELCELLKVSRTYLWELRTGEGLPHCKMGRMIRYRTRDVIDWLERDYDEVPADVAGQFGRAR